VKEKIMRYSESFRRMVVTEYEAGNSILGLQKKYGIKGSDTIRLWIKKYAKEGFRTEVVRIQRAEEIVQVNELEKKIAMLEQALGKLTLEKIHLESIIEILEETYGEDVKKNAAKLLSERGKKFTRKMDNE